MNFFPVALVLVFWATPVISGQDLENPRVLAESNVGFAQIFNFDYDQAIDTFSRLRSQYPQHPAPPLYMAITLWQRELFERENLDLDKLATPDYFLERPKQSMPVEARQKFTGLVEESRNLAEAALRRNPGDINVQYYLATGYGVRAAFTITVDHSKTQALNYGKKSYELHRRIVSRDAQYYDSYMALGIYEYIVANLPWYAKWVANIAGYHGTQAGALKYLHLAVERGPRVADEARLILIVIYFRDAKFKDALALEDYLQKKYPRSFNFPLTRAEILEKMGDKNEAVAEYETVISKTNAGVPNYDKLKLSTARYFFGRKFLDLGRADLALPQFLASIDDDRTPSREKTLSRLGSGQALDQLGRRAAAVAQYRQVLASADIEGSRSQAKTLMKRPYSPRDHQVERSVSR